MSFKRCKLTDDQRMAALALLNLQSRDIGREVQDKDGAESSSSEEFCDFESSPSDDESVEEDSSSDDESLEEDTRSDEEDQDKSVVEEEESFEENSCSDEEVQDKTLVGSPSEEEESSEEDSSLKEEMNKLNRIVEERHAATTHRKLAAITKKKGDITGPGIWLRLVNERSKEHQHGRVHGKFQGHRWS
jgi:hypothetical protein